MGTEAQILCGASRLGHHPRRKARGASVFANGDVWTAEDAEHILRYTGADAALIGRGSFGNPWLFAQGNALLAGEKVPPLPPRARADGRGQPDHDGVLAQGRRSPFWKRASGFCWYLRRVSHAGYYKQQIVSMNTLADAEKIVRGIQRDLRVTA